MLTMIKIIAVELTFQVFFVFNIKIYNNENYLGEYLQATLLTLQGRCHGEQNTINTSMAITQRQVTEINVKRNEL